MEKTNKSSEKPQLKSGLEGNYLIDKKHKAEKTAGIFYAPSGGSVHKVARMLKRKLADFNPDMFNISDLSANKSNSPASKFLDYQVLILVSSSLGRNTWEMEQKDPWSSFLPNLHKINLEGRKVAIVGLGDHVTYPNNFVDGMCILADTIEEIGGQLIGATETKDYVFNDSKALRDGKFLGLPLDEDYEKEKTEARIDNWLPKITKELKIKN